MSKAQKAQNQTPERDPVGSFEHGVIALFEGGPLSAIGFPGVDRTILLDAVRGANEAQLVVEASERDLEQSRRELGDKMSELGKLARRAVAYARVLAEDDAVLAEKLESLSPRASEPMRTTRKRRSKGDATAMLPTLSSEAEADDELAAE